MSRQGSNNNTEDVSVSQGDRYTQEEGRERNPLDRGGRRSQNRYPRRRYHRPGLKQTKISDVIPTENGTDRTSEVPEPGA